MLIQNNDTNGDLKEFEMLALKCNHIKEKIYGKDHIKTIQSTNTLSNVIQAMWYIDDAIILLERCKDIAYKSNSEDGNDTAIANIHTSKAVFNKAKRLPIGEERAKQL